MNISLTLHPELIGISDEEKITFLISNWPSTLARGVDFSYAGILLSNPGGKTENGKVIQVLTTLATA